MFVATSISHFLESKAIKALPKKQQNCLKSQIVSFKETLREIAQNPVILAICCNGIMT